MSVTSIEWTQGSDGTPGYTWNPTVGCTRISPGCARCYAFQLHDMRHEAYQAGKKLPLQYAKPFKEIQLMPDRLTDPLRWKKPRRVFVNSVSDLFHEDIPDDFIDKVFAVMTLAKQHTFQVLTKRAERMKRYFNELPKRAREWWGGDGRVEQEFLITKLHDESSDPIRQSQQWLDCVPPYTVRSLDWPLPNVWLGVSCENQQHGVPRIDILRQTPAAVRFLSVEPLLEDVGELNLTGIHWVIVGGESGPGARPCDVGWIRSIVKQCQAAGVPVFVKQLGSNAVSDNDADAIHADSGTKYALGTLLLKDRKGGDVAEFPLDLRIREFPATHS